MRKRTSLKDIADKLGVSTALVSYVLNNKKEGRISKEIAARIRETAQALKYTTNQIAKSLKTSRTFTIGLIVSDISNPFFSSFARIIQDEADKNGYTVIFGSSDERVEKSDKLIKVFLDRQVDGFIIAATEGTASQILELKENGIPLVLIDRYFPGIQVSHVAIDNFSASFRAVSHMVKSGLIRIAIVTHDSDLFHMQQRLQGYLAALREHNLSFDDSRVKKIPQLNREEEVQKAINELVSAAEPAEGILFTSNVLSTFALKHLNNLSPKVPDDLSIVSFDESDASFLFYAPLTHLKQPLMLMGKTATDMLLRQIENPEEVRKVNLPADLIIGRSTRSLNSPGVDREQQPV